MRIATYNVEWFDALFDRNAKPLIRGTGFITCQYC